MFAGWVVRRHVACFHSNKMLQHWCALLCLVQHKSKLANGYAILRLLLSTVLAEKYFSKNTSYQFIRFKLYSPSCDSFISCYSRRTNGSSIDFPIYSSTSGRAGVWYYILLDLVFYHVCIFRSTCIILLHFKQLVIHCNSTILFQVYKRQSAMS